MEEELLEPCPYDQCQGDGIIFERDGDGAIERKCICVKTQEKEHEANRDT